MYPESGDTVGPYSRSPGRDEVALGGLAAVADRAKELGVGPPEAGELLGIALIALALVASDHPCLAGIGDKDAVAEGFKKSG